MLNELFPVLTNLSQEELLALLLEAIYDSRPINTHYILQQIFVSSRNQPSSSFRSHLIILTPARLRFLKLHSGCSYFTRKDWAALRDYIIEPLFDSKGFMGEWALNTLHHGCWKLRNFKIDNSPYRKYFSSIF